MVTYTLYRNGTDLDLVLDHLDIELADGSARPEGDEGRVEHHCELESDPADKQHLEESRRISQLKF